MYAASKRQESPLKAKQLKILSEQSPDILVLRHQDVRTNGIPDVSTTGGGRTCWWEMKHGTPHFNSQGLQELITLRLAVRGFARYVVWLEEKDGTNKRTLIVHPMNFKDLKPEKEWPGFDFQEVATYIRQAHML